LAREVVTESQRARLLDAMAQAVAERGYAGATVADVVARAGVSRKTFYEHFRDKEECFLAAYDAGVEVVLAAIRDAEPVDGSWAGDLRARVRAYLETLATEPAFTRTFMIEVFAAGEAALERRARVLDRFAALLRELHEQARRDTPELPAVPELVFAASVGAVNELVTTCVREGRTADVPALEDTVVYLDVALFAGHDAAAALPASASPLS
jgi:AcrR family transcriptional regulator